MLEVNNMFQTFKEPYVDLCQLFNTLNAITIFKGLGNGKDAEVGRILELVVEIVETGVLVAHKTMHALTNHTKTLLYHLLERAAYGHDFANRLHRRADETTHTGKLGEVPTWYLADHIVELRSCIS